VRRTDLTLRRPPAASILCLRSARYVEVPSLAARVRILVSKQIKPIWDSLQAEREQAAAWARGDRLDRLGRTNSKVGATVDKYMTKFWGPHLQILLASHEIKLRKVFHFISATERGDPFSYLSFNHVLDAWVVCDLFSPQLNVKRAAKVWRPPSALPLPSSSPSFPLPTLPAWPGYLQPMPG
jgi:hypothetical protein